MKRKKNTRKVEADRTLAVGKSSKKSSSEAGAQSEVVAVHLVSEATGNLARHVASVTLSQFPRLEYVVHSHSLCSTAADLAKAKKAIVRDQHAIAFSALMKPRLNRSFASWCDKHAVRHYDLVNSAIEFVAESTGKKPNRNAFSNHRCDDQYYRRMEAWEFTLQHDDNRRLETIGQSDLILLGVSRVGKTPLAAYLGSIGYRVANVAIAREAVVPAEVVAHRSKTIGLTIDPERLAQIRKRRFELNRFDEAIRARQGRSDNYSSCASALADVDFAERLFRRLRILTLDMTELTIEESAARVLQLLED